MEEKSTEKAKINKQITKAGLVCLVLAIFNASASLPITGSLPIYNILKEELLKRPFKIDFIEYGKRTRIDYEKAFVTPIGLAYPVSAIRIERTKWHPLLEGLTEEEFCEIVDSYNGPIDYAALTKYVKDRKNKLIEERGK